MTMTPERARELIGHTPGPVAWEIWVEGCGSINSETFVTRYERTATQWADKGAVVSPLFKAAAPDLLAGYLALAEENERLREALIEADNHFGPFADITINGRHDPEDVRVVKVIRTALKPKEPKP